MWFSPSQLYLGTYVAGKSYYDPRKTAGKCYTNGVIVDEAVAEIVGARCVHCTKSM